VLYTTEDPVTKRSNQLWRLALDGGRPEMVFEEKDELFGIGRTLGEELLEPTRIYAKDCLALAAETKVRTFCHVTGGGLAGNLERVSPNGLVAEIDRGSWSPAPIFGLIAQRGRVDRAEMEKTFNMGIGMVAVVAPDDVDRALAILTARHLDCWTLGGVTKGKDGPRTTVVGQHPRF
jgi:phosphoribosylformylglycinamidine cyclo-ligase